MIQNTLFHSKLLHPRYWLSWLGVALIQLLGRLPLPLLWALGGITGRLAYFIVGQRRQVARHNLACCFPHLNAVQREWLVWTHFGWLGVAAFSQGVNWGISRARVKRLIRIKNQEVINHYLTVKRPIILLAPHFLALDLGGAGLMAQVHPGIHMYQRLRHPVFNWRVQRARCQFGSIPVERQADLRNLIRTIKTGAPFIYLPDQDAGRRGIFVPFCGQAAATVPMLGRFAALTNAVVIPTITRFLPWGRGVELIFAAPLEQFPSGDPIADTTRMNQTIESWLPQLAPQYFWVHRRFKTRPPGQAALYPPKKSTPAFFSQKWSIRFSLLNTKCLLREWLIGLTLLALLLGAVEYSNGWATLLAPWQELSPLLLAWLFSLTALSYGLRAVRLRAYFYPQFIGQFPLLLRLTIFHNVANNLLPMRSGELVFPWLMRRYFNYDFIDATAALLWIRVLDMHVLGLIAIFILNLRQPSLLWWLIAAGWIGSLSLITYFQQRHTAQQLHGNGRLLTLLRQTLRAAPVDWRFIAQIYGWTLLIWSFKFTAFVSVLQFFLPLDYWQLFTGVMGAELSSVLPIHGVAGSGSYELAAVAALAPLGIDPKLALVGVVNLHLFLLGSTVLLSVFALLLPAKIRTINNSF